jgi:hypothetical protein
MERFIDMNNSMHEQYLKQLCLFSLPKSEYVAALLKFESESN